MKNIKYIIFLLCIILCDSYTAEYSSSHTVKVPPLNIGGHQRKRSNSEPQLITTSQHIVISPRKKRTSSRTKKYEKENRARGKEAVPMHELQSFSSKKSIDSIAEEGNATLLLRRDAALVTLSGLKKEQEHCEWVIDDTKRELEVLRERVRKECLTIAYDQHATKGQKHKIKKILQDIEDLARDELCRQQMFSDYLDSILHNIQKYEQKLGQIQAFLNQNEDAVEEAV